MILNVFILLPSLWFILFSCRTPTTPSQLDNIVLPEGFDITVFADNIPNARSIRRANDTLVFVSTMTIGTIYALVDVNIDGRADRVVTVATGLTLPNGIAYRDGSLYVSDGARIRRFDEIASRLGTRPESVVVIDDLPSEVIHGWRYMDFGPDGRLYVSIGAPCNVCDRGAPFASIISMKPDGSDRRVAAQGVRNSVGFDWSPIDGAFWFSDNGRDHMGDDLPSCELNRVALEGAHFGFPYIHQGDLPDPEFGRGHAASDYVAPEFLLGAHVAPLGIEFYTGNMFPSDYQNELLVAEHGSWNRSSKVGYRVVRIRFDAQRRPVGQEIFLEGFLQGETSWGRPVDLETLSDGSLLLSDDLAGAVYRIAYE